MGIEFSPVRAEKDSFTRYEMKIWGDPEEPEFVNLLKSSGIDSKPSGIDSLESIPGLLIRLQIRAQGLIC